MAPPTSLTYLPLGFFLLSLSLFLSAVYVRTVTSDVPEDVITTLKELGSEIESVPAGMGYSSGMFWRFMVAVDPAVDRYIIRDVDSRLNARDR